MDQKNIIAGLVVALIIGVILGFLIFRSFAGSSKNATTHAVSNIDVNLAAKPPVTEADLLIPKIVYLNRTRVKTVPGDTVIQYQYQTDTIFEPHYINDSLLITKPFEAKIDTAINMDTVRFRFCWPEGVVKDYYHAGDSVRIHYKRSDTIQLPPQPAQISVWERYGIPILTGGLGYLFGRVK